MREEGLGPNGAMLYCMEYLEQNLDWLVDGLKELDGDYFVFDVPGQVGSTAWYPVMRSLGCDPDSSDCLSYFTSLQVELSTNHNSLTRIMESLRRLDYRVRPPSSLLGSSFNRN